MLLDIALKELRESLFSIRFLVTMAVILLLVSAVVVALSADYKRQINDYHKRVETDRKSTANYTAGQPATIDRPVPALSALFVGLESTAPNQIQLQPAQPPSFAQIADVDATEVLFPSIDLGFCIGVVLSLAALLFSYDVITGEKENGSLRQILSYPVSRATVILGKWMAVFATLSIAAIVTVSYAVLLLKSIPGSPFSIGSGDWASLGLILLTSLIYLSGFSLLGIFVSSLVSKSATSLAVLMLVWVIAVFVFPNVSPYLAVSITPAPTFQEAARKQSNVDTELMNELKARHQQGAKKVLDEGMNAKQLAEVRDGIQSKWDSEHKIAMTGLENDFQSRINRQEQTGARLTSVSPYGSLVYIFTSLADSGLRSDENFLRQARLFEQDQLMPFAKSNSGNENSSAPNFVYQPTPLAQRFSSVSVELSILLAYNLVLFFGSYLAFRRYDVR